MNPVANPFICCSEKVSVTDNFAAKSGAAQLSLMSRVTIWTIAVYQGTRILRAPSCRFYPSCSQYMADSMRRFGFFRGLVLGLVRLAKCHPWHQGGIDDVPANFSIGNR